MDTTSMNKTQLCDEAVKLGLFPNKSKAREVKIEELRKLVTECIAEDAQDEQSMGDDLPPVIDPEQVATVARERIEEKIAKLLDRAENTRGVPYASKIRREAAKQARKLARKLPAPQVDPDVLPLAERLAKVLSDVFAGGPAPSVTFAA